MQAQPLPKSLYDKAKSLKIVKICLEFLGGSDEGFLNVDYFSEEDKSIYDVKFNSEVEEWAWEVYDYSGGGDGNDYGDNITYNLAENTVETSEWAMVRQDGDFESKKLEISQD